MSDALTDSGRDQKRARLQKRVILLILEHLQEGEGASLEKVMEAARSCDAVPRGAFSQSTRLVDVIPERIRALKAGDRVSWNNFAHDLVEVWSEPGWWLDAESGFTSEPGVINDINALEQLAKTLGVSVLHP